MNFADIYTRNFVHYLFFLESTYFRIYCRQQLDLKFSVHNFYNLCSNTTSSHTQQTVCHQNTERRPATRANNTNTLVPDTWSQEVPHPVATTLVLHTPVLIPLSGPHPVTPVASLLFRSPFYYTGPDPTTHPVLILLPHRS